MNLLHGTPNTDGTAVILAGGAVLPLAAPVAHRGPVLVGLRPEHFTLAEADTGLELEVSNVESTGSETIIEGRIGAERAIALVRERVEVGRGARLALAAPPATLQLFDVESGQRL